MTAAAPVTVSMPNGDIVCVTPTAAAQLLNLREMTPEERAECEEEMAEWHRERDGDEYAAFDAYLDREVCV